MLQKISAVKLICNLTIVSLLLTLAGHAQVPGYMGKRLSVGYDFSFAPAIFGEGYHPPTEYHTVNLVINTRHNFNLDYLISRDVSIGVTYKRFQTGTDAIFKVNYVDPYNYSDAGRTSADYIIPMKTSCFGVTLKKFRFERKGSLAPLGRYFEFQLMYMSMHGEPVLDSSTNSNSNFFLDAEGNDFGTEHMIAGLFGVGRQMLYFDHLLVNTGFECGLSTAGLFNGADSENEYEYKKAIKSRAGGHILLNIYIGVGWIIF